MIIKRFQLYRILLSFFSLIFLMTISFENLFFISAMVILVIFNAAVTLNTAFKNKHFVYFIFAAFVLEILAAMFLAIYVFKIQETSWRVNYNLENINYLSMRFICISLLIMFFTYNCLTKDLKSSAKKVSLAWDSKFLLILYTSAILFLFIFLIVERKTFFTLRDYTKSTNTTFMSLYRILQVIFFTTYYKNTKETYGFVKLESKILFVCFVVIDALICINGFRFIFMEVILVLIFLNLEKMKKNYLFGIGILAVIVYVFFTIISMYRNGIVEINTDNFFKSIFGHERSEFYSLNAIILNRPENHINTYLNTISNIIPSVFKDGNLYENTGRILLRYISIDTYNSSEITYGGFYLTEAYFNFGAPGIYLVSFILSIFIIFIEKNASKNIITNLCYYMIISQSYTIIFYGSSNYFKPIFYYFVFSLLLYKFYFVKKHE